MSLTDEPNTMFELRGASIQLNGKESKYDLSSAGSITSKTKSDYHIQRLAQSKWAFRLSFWGSIAGFIVIVWSIYYGINTRENQWPGIISGIIVECISALFYNISNKANEKISEFFIELSKDANIEKSLELANEINNKDIRDALKVKLSLYLAGIDEEKICNNTCDVILSGNDLTGDKKDSYSLLK